MIDSGVAIAGNDKHDADEGKEWEVTVSKEKRLETFISIPIPCGMACLFESSNK